MTSGLPDPEWYFEHVLDDADPDGAVCSVTSSAGVWRRWWQAQVRPDDPVVALAATQGFVLSIAQLADLGVPRGVTRNALRTSRWFSPTRGVVAPVRLREDEDRFSSARRRHALEATGAVLARRDHVVSGVSSAIVHGLPTLAVPRRPELTARGEVGLGRRSSALVRGAGLANSEIGRWCGAPVTTVERTVVDVARHSRRDGLIVADAALGQGLVQHRDLASALMRSSGWPGVRQAREVVELVRGDAESPLESLVRLALHDSGFPTPEVQYRVPGTHYRVDFCWPQAQLVLEADGRVKYVADELWREKRREDVLRRCGLRVERITWGDLTRDWARFAKRLRAYFAL